jgi:hypothetical protein
MKKALSLILSVIILLGTFSILAFADSTPEISIKTDKQTVRKNDKVTVSVNVSKNSKICATTVEFVYDTDYFTLDSVEAKGTFGTEQVNEKIANGRVRYVAAQINGITAEATLFTVKLKVKKPNGKVSLDIKEAWIDNNGTAEDVTSQVKAKYASLPETILTCRHDLKETVVSQPTCDKDGSKVQECKICGWKSESVINALGHKYKDVKVSATCDKDGKEYKECTVCGKKADEKVIKATGHDDKLVTIEPTCDKNGETYLQCKTCGRKTESAVLKATHKAGDWEVVKEATETETGKKVKKCTVCGEIVEEKEIPATITAFGKGDVDGNGKVTAIDARMILQHVAGIKTLNLLQMTRADVNGDYKITAVDARVVLRAVAGL